MRGLAEDLRQAAHGWAEQTAQEQGLGAKVSGEVLASVALLLSGGSGPPDGRQARVVELVQPPPAGANENVIEDGCDDLLLAG